MNASRLNEEQYKSLILHPTFENVHALLAEIHVFIFGADGRLVQSCPVRKGKAAISLREEESRDFRIVIAPPFAEISDVPLTLEAARSRNVFETKLELEEGRVAYTLPPVPETVWRWWMVEILAKNLDEIYDGGSFFLIW